MKIFYAFLVIVSSALLFMLPITSTIYDFRTDLREDTFVVTTAAGITSANTTLLVAIYNDDTQTINYTSNTTEAPIFSSFNATSRQLTTAGLAEATTRALVVAYDISALPGADALNNLLDKIPLIWMLMVISFPIAALASMFVGRN